MKSPVLILVATSLSFAPLAASAFTVEHQDAGTQANIVNRDALLQPLANGESTPTSDHSRFSFSISGGNNGWTGASPSSADHFPTLPGSNNQLTPAENARALQYAISPFGPRH